MYYCGENFLKRKLFPAPLSKNLQKRIWNCFCFVRSTIERIMFALHPRSKFLVKFFSKNLRVWAEPIKTARSFCQAFSLRLSCQRKSGIMRFYVFYAGKKTFLKKSFSSPKPHLSKNFETGVLFFIIISVHNRRA